MWWEGRVVAAGKVGRAGEAVRTGRVSKLDLPPDLSDP